MTYTRVTRRRRVTKQSDEDDGRLTFSVCVCVSVLTDVQQRTAIAGPLPHHHRPSNRTQRPLPSLPFPLPPSPSVGSCSHFLPCTEAPLYAGGFLCCRVSENRRHSPDQSLCRHSVYGTWASCPSLPRPSSQVPLLLKVPLKDVCRRRMLWRVRRDV